MSGTRELPPETSVEDSGPRRVAEALALLRAEYSAALPDKVDALVRAVHASRRRAGDAELSAEARSHAHRLRGTSGSYGLHEVSLAAGRIEELLERSGAASSGLDDELDALVDLASRARTP